MKKSLILIFFGILAGFFEAGFLRYIGGYIYSFAFIFPLLLIQAGRKDQAVIFAFSSGITMGLFGVEPMGIYVVALLAAIFTTDFLLKFFNIFTFRSAAISNFAGLFIGNLVFYLLTFVTAREIAPSLLNSTYWLNFFVVSFFTVLILLIFFRKQRESALGKL